MIIDFHVHIRKDKGTVDNFLRGMDQNNIDISVVHPIVPGGTLGLSDTEFVGQLCKEHPDRLLGFACVIPTELGAADELKAALDKYDFKGLKLHPPLQNFSMDDPRIAPCIEVCIERDIPILIHTGGIYTQGARMMLSDCSYIIDDLAIRYPKCKFVIAHGNPMTWDPVIVAKNPNVYMDTTGTMAHWCSLFPQLGPAVIEQMRTSDRLLYGSDANAMNTQRFVENLKPMLEMDISEEVRNKILCENAKKLLKIK